MNSQVRSSTTARPFGRTTTSPDHLKAVSAGRRALWIASFLLVSPALAGAQTRPDPGIPLRLFDRFTLTVPPQWKPGSQTPASQEIFIPLSRTAPSPQSSDTNPKPRFVVGADIGMLITIESRRSHAEALRRLAEVASEQPERPTKLVISRWPAVERRYLDLMPQTGETELGGGQVVTWFATTAVALDAYLVRFDSMLAPHVDSNRVEEALALARTLEAPGGDREVALRELEMLERVAAQPQAPPPTPVAASGSERPQPASGGVGVAVRVQNGVGEVEVAASNDGSHVVVAANSGFSFSDDFGAGWTFGGGTPCTQAVCDGDPSLAVGQSGAIYYAWIGGPSGTQLGDGISRSTDNGHTFPFASMAVNCPGVSSCSVADQEHIAADRSNAGTLGDRVYNVWRNFPTAGAFSLRIVCSRDNAATWGAQQVIGAGDFPRVQVGRDGFVYVAWASGGNMMLHKYSDCDAGLVAQPGFPVVASAFTNVVCPVAGLDRCNGRNILSSPVVAVDDLDGDHVYYSFTTSTGAGNEDVMVFDSTDGGLTFPRSVRVNSAVAGRRFMSWASAYGGVAAVSWYDRRTATMANNDRTRFFIGSAWVKGSSLVAGAELDLSGIDDTQCANWPCATNATTDSESCSVQPQLAGRCANPVTGVGSLTACDFSTSVCIAPETCLIGRGCPKYGDYNGNAAAAGRLYSAWTSFVTPVGGAAGTGLRVFASADRLPSDFFVRDWTASATAHDGGQQPSTSAVFWSTSDVWNQSSNVAAAFPAADWILGDPPSRVGSNFAFARVSRRAAAAATAPAASVTVTFLQADYGLGVPYSIVGSETVSFAAGDMTKVSPGRSWAVPATASNHLCLGVQISAPDGDAFAAPSLDTLAVGPSDPLIVIDNNKAQRNLAQTVGTEAGTEMFAVIENAEQASRRMEIGIRWSPGARAQARASIVGGESIDLGEFAEGRIRVGELKPRERRWLRFSVLPRSDEPITVDFFDTAASKGDVGGPSNGFTIQFARAPVEVVAARNMRALADVMTRLATLEKNGDAKRTADATLKAMSRGKLASDRYAAFLRRHRAAVWRILASHLRAASGSDPFEIRGAFKSLTTAIDAEDVEGMAAAHNALNERLDAHLTMSVRSGR